MISIFSLVQKKYPKCNIQEEKNYASFSILGTFIYELRLQKEKIRFLASNNPKKAKFGECFNIIQEHKIEGRIIMGNEIILEAGKRSPDKFTLRIEIPYEEKNLNDNSFIQSVIDSCDEFHRVLLPLLNHFQKISNKELSELMSDNSNESEKNIFKKNSSVKEVYLFEDPKEFLFAVQSLRNYYFGLSNNVDNLRFSYESYLKEFTIEFIIPRISNDIIRELHLNGVPVEPLLLPAMFDAEEEYEKEFATHQEYISSLDRYIKKILEQSDEILLCGVIKFLIKLGNILDEDESPTGNLTIQDRFFPIFLILMKSPEFKKQNILHELSEIEFFGVSDLLMKASGKYNQLTSEEKFAIVLYDFILIWENNELEIKIDDISKAKKIISLINQNNQNEHLIGGFQDCFVFDVFQFFNVWVRPEEFHAFCLERWKQLQSEWNILKLQMIMINIEHAFTSELLKEKPVFESYNKIFMKTKNTK